MTRILVKDLLEAGVHFGHRTQKWNPKMKPFIFEARNGIYVIDLNQTATQLEKAMEFLKTLSSKDGKVLFVGCKKQSQNIIKEFATKCSAYYVTERWLGGTLTNLNTIRRSVARMNHIEEIERNGKIHDMPKQEASALRREHLKLFKNLNGLRDMEKQPDAIVIVDPSREDIAVREAKRLNIPIIAINDTNSDPDLIDFPIPGNDDAIRSIRIILDYLSEAIVEGAALRTKTRADKKDKSKGHQAESTKTEAPAVANA